MPIDYLGRKRQLEGDVNSLLAKQYADVPDQSKKILESVRGARSGFLGQTGLNPTAIAMQSPRMERKLEGDVADIGFNRQGSLLESKFNYYFNLAQEAGLDVQQAKAYARQKAALDRQQQFTAGQSALDRASQERMMKTKESFVDQGVQLQDQYKQEYDPAGALIRILAGTGVGIGTAYALNKNWGGTKTSPSTAPVAGQSGNADSIYDRYFGYPIQRNTNRPFAGT